MTTEIKIRRVLQEDVPALAALSKQTFYDTFTGTCTEEDMQQFLVDYFAEHVVAKEVADINDHYYFAEVNDIPVGYIRFMEDYRNFAVMKKWKSLELKRIYILNEYQGKGIAQALMDFYLTYAKEHHYEAAWLGVWEHNMRAQSFYKKYGFEFSGHTHDFPIGNTPQTDFWMWKFL